MFVDFFIRRPVFATVCALLIILAGAVVIPSLPVAQFPTLAPPQISVTSAYIGASAQTVETAVTIPLEEQINGAEGMKYITSSSGNDGSSSIVAAVSRQLLLRGRSGRTGPSARGPWNRSSVRSPRPIVATLWQQLLRRNERAPRRRPRSGFFG